MGPGFDILGVRSAAGLGRRLLAILSSCGLVVALGAGSALAAELSSNSVSGGLSQAQAAVRRYSQPPKSIGVTTPLSNAKSLRGKRIDYLEQPLQVMKTIGDNLVQAAVPLGVTVNRINAGSTPESWGRAFDQAVQDSPDAVLAGPIPAAVVGTQLGQLAAKHIPVVVWTSADVPQPGNGVSDNFDGIPYYQRQGQLMADWVTADSKGSGKAVLFNIPDFPSLAPLANSFTARLKSVCPKCSQERVNVGADSIATALPGRVVSYLQQNPDVRYVVMGFGDMAIGVPEALSGASLSGNAKLVTQSGEKLNYQYVKNGQQAVEGATPFGFYAWKLMDTTARLMLGASVAPDHAQLMPTQLLTRKDITFDLNQPWPGVPNYQAAFKKLWGV
jgi:ribose transport system substrate-binding protein